MSGEGVNVRRVPVTDVKQEQNRLLVSRGLVDADYTGTVVLTLHYHRGAINTMKLDRPITL